MTAVSKLNSEVPSASLAHDSALNSLVGLMRVATQPLCRPNWRVEMRLEIFEIRR